MKQTRSASARMARLLMPVFDRPNPQGAVVVRWLDLVGRLRPGGCQPHGIR
jgi:hypothetical protein